MANIFTPEDILPDGDDHTTVVNPFTGFQANARKGTVAATLSNIALLDRLFQVDTDHDQIAKVKKAIIDLMPSLKATGIFDLFNSLEWISNPKYLGRTYVALLYLKHYPNEINKEITSQLQAIQKTIQIPSFQAEFLELLGNSE